MVAGGIDDHDLLGPWRCNSNPSTVRKSEALQSDMVCRRGVATRMVGSGELYLTVALGNEDSGEREILVLFFL